MPELISAFTYALDVAEGREPGHAVKVAYIAALIARELDIDEEVLFGFTPLHAADATEVPVTQQAQEQDALRMHVTAGTAFLTAPWFP